MEQRGDSPALVNHDGVTKSVFAHLVPAKGVDFPSCEKLLRWKGQERRRQTVFFLWTRSGTKETKNSTMICRGREKCTTNCEWKPHQDTVYWIHLARAQEQGLQFRRTRSHAMILLRFSASRLHRASGIREWRQNFASNTLYASACSEKKSHKCLQLKAAATAAAARHLEEHRDT